MAAPENSGIPLAHDKVTINHLYKMKEDGHAIAALSIYDANFARFFDEAGGEVIIVGDSASMAAMGRPNTLPTTMEEMLAYSGAVCRGTKRLFVVGDMPLGSYEISNELAVANALRFMKEVGDRPCNAVKIEINMDYIERVRAIAKACLVVAHIGLNPNKAEMLGGYRTLGKTKKSAQELCEVALAAEEAMACMILIESVPEEVSQAIQERLTIPVIGIAAGRKLDGQLLISADLLDFYAWPGSRKPRHFKIYKTERSGLTPGGVVREAFSWYVQAVKSGELPGEENVHFLPAKDRGEVERYFKEERSMRRP